MTSINAINFTANNKKPKKEKKNIKGGLLAMGAGNIAQLSSLPVGLIAIKGLTKPSNSLSQDEIKLVNKGAQTILNQKTDLGKKGVQIINAEGMSSPLKETLPKWFTDLFSPIDAAANGKNAFFTDKTMSDEIKANSVLVNKNKLPLSTFHELGHAFNNNCSGFWKTMQKMRTPAMVLSGLFALVPALTKNHEAKEGEELTGKQKFINGLRKASPILASLSFAPILLEEGMATLRGNKWAKDIFKDTPELAKKVAKTNKWGFISYAASALAVGFGAWITTKVKDNSDKKKALKFEQAQYAESKLSKIPKNRAEAHQG